MRFRMPFDVKCFAYSSLRLLTTHEPLISYRNKSLGILHSGKTSRFRDIWPDMGKEFPITANGGLSLSFES